jgi:hypothetical protein
VVKLPSAVAVEPRAQLRVSGCFDRHADRLSFLSLRLSLHLDMRMRWRAPRARRAFRRSRLADHPRPPDCRAVGGRWWSASPKLEGRRAQGESVVDGTTRVRDGSAKRGGRENRRGGRRCGRQRSAGAGGGARGSRGAGVDRSLSLCQRRRAGVAVWRLGQADAGASGSFCARRAWWRSPPRRAPSARCSCPLGRERRSASWWIAELAAAIVLRGRSVRGSSRPRRPFLEARPATALDQTAPDTASRSGRDEPSFARGSAATPHG